MWRAVTQQLTSFLESQRFQTNKKFTKISSGGNRFARKAWYHPRPYKKVRLNAQRLTRNF